SHQLRRCLKVHKLPTSGVRDRPNLWQDLARTVRIRQPSPVEYRNDRNTTEIVSNNRPLGRTVQNPLTVLLLPITRLVRKEQSRSLDVRVNIRSRSDRSHHVLPAQPQRLSHLLGARVGDRGPVSRRLYPGDRDTRPVAWMGEGHVRPSVDHRLEVRHARQLIEIVGLPPRPKLLQVLCLTGQAESIDVQTLLNRVDVQSRKTDRGVELLQLRRSGQTDRR